ncbi:Zinc finger protein [Operophtera brumata]|uniref:Zinc finger protein n=1 Tax=Operophtera brumata TaxID=104452 RepID=A0A0L7KU88_OPEBR|nr:Zinc finger protein [Operophtera brumata]
MHKKKAPQGEYIHITAAAPHHGGVRDCFLGQNGLNMHKKKAHRSSVEYLACASCGSKFRSQDALSRHRVQAVHDTCDTTLR